jgi:hypothetical protein
MNILYFADDQRLVTKLHEELFPKMPEPRYFDGIIGKDVEVLILFTPIRCNGTYVAMEEVWLKYCRKKAPHVKLIFAGFEPITHTNYLNPLHLPADWSVWLSAALPSSAGWEAPASTALDGQILIDRFYKGHGHDSVRSYFDKFSIIFNNIEPDLDNGSTVQELMDDWLIPAKLAEKWAVFRIRWANFYPWSMSMPMFNEFQKMEEHVRQINHFFQPSGFQFDLIKELRLSDDSEAIGQLIETTKNIFYG